MEIQNLTPEVWTQLDRTGNSNSGYKTIIIENSYKSKKPTIHIFVDELGNYHFAIEDEETERKDLIDPNINGLNVSLIKYRISGKKLIQLIDITCNLKSYLDQFTEVIKEIVKSIIEENESPVVAVNKIIRNWKSFWDNKNRNILSENETVGLICELIILKKLLKINSSLALNSWRGPLGERHDFNFTDWTFEVKATTSQNLTHKINGIDQLKPFENKSLALISFLVTVNNNRDSIDLVSVIEEITDLILKTPELIIRFNDLLSYAGYSPLYRNLYRQFKINILESILFKVDESFPTLTSENLKSPLDNRISGVSYNISLQGLPGQRLSSLNLGNYFY